MSINSKVDPIGMKVRAFRLDGTSVEGTVAAVSKGPRRELMLEGSETFPDHLCEPVEDQSKGYKVHSDSLAYELIDELIGAHWSPQFPEYFRIDWQKHTLTCDLRTLHGQTFDDKGRLLHQGKIDAAVVIEKLGPVLWRWQEDELGRLVTALENARDRLGSRAWYAQLPRWAVALWPKSKPLFGEGALQMRVGNPSMLVSVETEGLGRWARIHGLPR